MSDDIRKSMLESARKGPNRMGKNSLIKHLTGKRITKQQAIDAKCYDCNGMGEQKGCDIDICPLYPYRLDQRKSSGTRLGGPRRDKKGIQEANANPEKGGQE